MNGGIDFDPGPREHARCALCGLKLNPENLKGIISAQYYTCNMDKDAPRHSGEELRAYFKENGVSFA